jgi:hypothetical protein
MKTGSCKLKLIGNEELIKVCGGARGNPYPITNVPGYVYSDGDIDTNGNLNYHLNATIPITPNVSLGIGINGTDINPYAGLITITLTPQPFF